jgi:hypothetical protein
LFHGAFEAGGGFEIEKVIGAVEPDLAFFLVEVAMGVAFFEVDSVFSGGIAVLLKGQEAFAETSHGVEHAEVMVGVVFVFLMVFADAETKIAKVFAELSEGDLESNDG